MWSTSGKSLTKNINITVATQSKLARFTSDITLYVVDFFCVQRVEIIRFVDIGFDHHCLNFLFIINVIVKFNMAENL